MFYSTLREGATWAIELVVLFAGDIDKGPVRKLGTLTRRRHPRARRSIVTSRCWGLLLESTGTKRGFDALFFSVRHGRESGHRPKLTSKMGKDVCWGGGAGLTRASVIFSRVTGSILASTNHPDSASRWMQ